MPCGAAESAEVTLLALGLSPGAKAGGRLAVVSFFPAGRRARLRQTPSSPPLDPPRHPPHLSRCPGHREGRASLSYSPTPGHKCHCRPPAAIFWRGPASPGGRWCQLLGPVLSADVQQPPRRKPPLHGLPPAPLPSWFKSASFTGASRLSRGPALLGRRTRAPGPQATPWCP